MHILLRVIFEGINLPRPMLVPCYMRINLLTLTCYTLLYNVGYKYNDFFSRSYHVLLKNEHNGKNISFFTNKKEMNSNKFGSSLLPL